MSRTLILFFFLTLTFASRAAADCKSDVNGAFDKLRQSASFRMRTTIVNDQGSLRMTVDYVPPDRMHQKVTVSNGDGPLELIVIGTRAWSNNGQGWAELPPTYAEHVAGELKATVADPPAQDTEFVCLGDVELEGKSYAAYRAWIAAKPGADAGATGGPRNVQTVYVDKATGLPERNIVTPERALEKRIFDGTFSFPDALSIAPPDVASAP